MHFAEIYFTASNSRLFNLNVENGQALLSNYDIFVQAGGNNIAKIEQYNNINVSDGQLTITTTSVKDNAKISAIEIISTVSGGGNTAPTVATPIADQTVSFNTSSLSVNLANAFVDNNGAANITLSITGNSNFAIVTQATLTGTNLNLTLGAGQAGSSTIKVKATDAEGLFVEDEFIVTINSAGAPTTHIRINSGGPAQTYGSETWIADAYFTNGTAYPDGGSIANTTMDQLYQTERYGNHSYNIPVPNGAYTVKLHFAEVSHNSANARLFNVNIENGQAALTNYDLFVQAGGANIAKIEQFNNVNVTDGFMTIAFTSLVNNAKISAIEVISAGVGGNQNPIAAAGSDATINLPNSVVSLSGVGSNDPDGNITTYAWSKFSGPSSYNITSPGSISTTVTGLVAGTYVFRLTVTDNNQATGFDDVTIIVNDNSGGSPTTTFIALNGSWKYLDNGSNQGTAWKEVGYSDQSWASGNGEFGYGDGDEGTIVSYGGNSNNKHITTYFRKSITISDPASFSSFALGVKRDDGIVVYVNGSEVYRNNMPSGTINYNTLATTAASDDGATIQSITLPVSNFASGVNVIAAEIHQSVQNSSDLSFDLRLIGNAGGSSPTVQILRGPYLQVGSSTAVTLRWRRMFLPIQRSVWVLP